jgi:site-specific DNA-methyltransferase (adenine-specific)
MTQWISSSVSSQKPFGLRSNFKDWTDKGVKCYSAGGKIRFCEESAFTDNFRLIDEWKVAVSKATVEGASFNGEIRTYINGGFVIEPGSICTETYLVVKTFTTKKEAENFISYMRTKFFRFMLGLRLVTQNISKEKFAWVPDMEDYTTLWADKELYDKFGLTRQERVYIESKIKELK